MPHLWQVWAFALAAWIVFEIPTGVSGTDFILCAIVYQGVKKCKSFEANQLLGMSVYTDGRPQNVFECTGRSTIQECTETLTSEGFECAWAKVPQKHVKTFGEGYCTLQVLDVAGKDYIESLYYQHVEQELMKKKQLFVSPVEGGQCMALSGSECEKSLKCSPCHVQRELYNINATQSSTICLHKNLLSSEQPELDWCAKFQEPFIFDGNNTFNNTKFGLLNFVYIGVNPIPPKFRNDSTYVRMFPLMDVNWGDEDEEDSDSDLPVDAGGGTKRISSSTKVPASRSSPSASSTNVSPPSTISKLERKPEKSENQHGTAHSAASLIETEETDDEGALSEPRDSTPSPPNAGSGWTLKALPIIACSSAVIVTLLAIPVYFSFSPLKRSQHASGAESECSNPSI